MSTNLKKHFIDFYQGWEPYVNECKRVKNNSTKYVVTKHHKTYQVLKESIVSEMQSLTDKRIYKVKGSVGQTGLTGIPWLSVMDRQVTESTQEKFYISYLFSKNAKRLHLSIALEQPNSQIYMETITKQPTKFFTKDLFVQNFNKYAPDENFETMDLLDNEDTSFIRKFSAQMIRTAKYYEGGSFFTKSYDLVEQNFDEDDLVNDLNRYIDSYRKIVNDPASSGLLDVLDESVFDETDQKKESDLNYELPDFNPIVIKSKSNDKTKKKRGTSQSRRPSIPSKKVGDAGEKYVLIMKKIK